MFRLQTALLIAITFSAFALADEKKSPLDRDRKALQGVWAVEAAYRDGEKVSDSDRMNGPVLYAIKFKDDTFQIALEKSGDEFKYAADPVKFSLDVSVDPKIAEFEFSNTEKGYCIYSIKGDKLTLCFNYQDGPLGAATKDRAKVPAKLETKAGDGRYLFVLKKRKGK